MGLDYDHFTGQRRWTESALQAAVASSETWTDVVSVLGLHGGSATATLKGHAARLGLDVTHLTQQCAASATDLRPDIVHLDRAGSMMAAAWFMLCGLEVSWPLEPCRYDLLVRREEAVRRVQVKTTRTREGSGWKVYLSKGRRERKPYDPDEIDDFFIIDGDLSYYVIPLATVGGLHAIRLGAYEAYRVTATSGGSDTTEPSARTSDSARTAV
ncbi:group I intron-associated PD-(D/E)XK endonuclease [Cellulosimicrobium sp. NPDC057127]|uniref:group I intron-associated PD-(D/E)XK endonuclease n=1 Tax=Cellulosimicrobium sp. NPDC057127 TaxID=3346026 RepID=UPI0036298669